MIFTAVVLAAACTVIEGDQIRVADLAKTIPAFAHAPAGEEIGLSPAPGAWRRLGRTDLARLAARFGVEAPADAQACFVRKATPLTQERISAALAKPLAGQDWKLVDFCRQPVPSGELEFLPPLRPRTDAPVLVNGRVHYGENRTFPVWARVRIVRPPREVERGDTVEAEIVSGGALLRLEARAEAAGGLGETVTVRNLQTKACFSARVIGKGKVILDVQQGLGYSARGSGRQSGR